jgi:hypothetical protein
MLFLTLLQHYLVWHYTRAFGEIAHVSKNLLWFVIYYFSIPQLIRSYFAPYRRITEERKRGFSLEDMASVLIINIISRIIGVVLRTTIILSGFTSLLSLFVLTLITYVVWLAAPVLILGSITYGITLLLTV